MYRLDIKSFDGSPGTYHNEYFSFFRDAIDAAAILSEPDSFNRPIAIFELDPDGEEVSEFDVKGNPID